MNLRIVCAAAVLAAVAQPAAAQQYPSQQVRIVVPFSAGITQVSAVSASFVVPPELPANNLKEFIALAQKSPGKMNFGSAGTASTSYLAGEIFKQIAKVNL